MQPLSTFINNPERRIQQFIGERAKRKVGWWTPIWRGLSADPGSKHRIAMGASLWLYLYLLTYANRKTGMVRRRMDQVQSDTGYPMRTIQRHLKRLEQKSYISLNRSKHYLHITIKKWKSFHNSDELPI
jgi:CRP-like cAMP-binding protein